MGSTMKVFQGTLVHATWSTPLEILNNKLIGVKDSKIVFVEDDNKLENLKSQHAFSDSDVQTLAEAQFLMPGLVDAHLHAPQYVFSGTGMNMELLEWLNTYTFPTEAMFKDVTFAEDAYRKAVGRIIKNGTTTACYFATIHLEATLKLCDIIAELGQRAYVGKVCMDTNSPDFYVEDTEQSLKDTEIFVQNIKNKKNPLVTPVITPRFAPTSTSSQLKGLAELAARYHLPIQSHISENRGEVDWIKGLFPECKHYADVYHTHGLYNKTTIMAHGVHLSDEELQLTKDNGVGIVHCPNSNTSIKSGLCDVRRLLDKGIKVGLGTDLCGGYHPSMFDAIRYAAQIANVLFIHKGPDYHHIDYQEAFRLATLGSSQVLGLEDRIGNFEVGKDFDALLINCKALDSPFDIFHTDKIQDVVQKFIYLGDDRNISEVYVAGSKIHCRTK